MQDCKAVPLPGGDWCEMRGRAEEGLKKRGEALPRQAAAHLAPVSSRAPASFAGWDREKVLRCSVVKCENNLFSVTVMYRVLAFFCC